jgi:cation:H+ antiporter
MTNFSGASPLWLNCLIFLASLCALVKIGDILVDGAIAVAKRIRVSPLVIGSTVLAMGTALDELIVNLMHIAADSNSDVPLGNVLGSNMVNLGIGLGLAAICTKLVSHSIILEKDIPMYLAFSAILTSFAYDGRITRPEGMLLILFFVIFLILLMQYIGRERKTVLSYLPHKHDTVATSRIIALTGGGLLGLLFLARIIVDTGSSIATAMGVSHYVISFTIIGIGTSLPEIIASFHAARKGYPDMALASVFSGNIFYICMALGIPALWRGLNVTSEALHDLYTLNIFNVIVLLFLLLEGKLAVRYRELGRLGGLLLIGTYLYYLVSKLL